MVDLGRPEKDILVGLYTAEHLGQLTSGQPTEQIRAASEVLRDMLRLTRNATVAMLFDLAFQCLTRWFPVEYVFKSCVLERLLFGRYSPRTTAFYTEFRIGNSRADVASLMALLMSTKSSRLTMIWLVSPLRSMTTTRPSLRDSICRFDTPRSSKKSTPEYTGIASNGYSISMGRPAMEYRERLDHSQLFRLLHQSEYISILNEFGVRPERIDPAHRFRYSLDAFRQLEIDEGLTRVVSALKRRQCTARLAEIANTLPRSLRVAPFAYRMARRDWRSLSTQMCMTI